MTDKNPSLVIAIVDFNASSSSWCINDKRIYKATKIDCLATVYDLKQVTNKPIHLLENLNLGVHPSLQANCLHLTVYANFNLKIQYPQREV